MAWRWDQGRLGYFQFDEIKAISRALVEIEGVDLPSGKQPDILRSTLKKYSSQPFAPSHYTVWRNYRRVFGCQLLATQIHGKLLCTDLCRSMAQSVFDVDDYFLHLTNRFYFPSPIFEGYNTKESQVFPFAAIVKFLLSRLLIGAPAELSGDDVFNFLVANDVMGLEKLEHFTTLKPKSYPVKGDADRQVRELLRFISQFSFLKWNKGKVYLDLIKPEEALKISKAISPIAGSRSKDPAEEILRIGRKYKFVDLGKITQAASINIYDQEFAEGSKTKTTHLRTERSTKLREIYFQHVPTAHICDACAMNTKKRYPWADRLIEVHHLLPLASPIKVERSYTSLKDVVGLCPTCHRATHKFYNKWLKTEKLKDFRSYSEAKMVYGLTKEQIVLSKNVASKS